MLGSSLILWRFWVLEISQSWRILGVVFLKSPLEIFKIEVPLGFWFLRIFTK
jgi:hypothetical protein